MFDDLAGLFQDNLVEAYKAYVKASDGDTSGRHRHLRQGIVLADALFHFREHLPAHHAMTRTQVESACADYRLVADVANASKHAHVTRPTPAGPSLVSSAEDINECTVITLYSDGDGEYSDARTRVFVDCSDGLERSLDDALLNTFNYWGGTLKTLGVIEFAPRPPIDVPGAKLVPRSEAKRLDSEMVQGMRFKQIVKLQKYDEANGRSVPVDLTGANISWNIYKPKYSIDVTVTPKDGTDSVICPIDLTEEQSVALHLLGKDTDRAEFIKRIIGERSGEVQRMVQAAMRDRKA